MRRRRYQHITPPNVLMGSRQTTVHRFSSLSEFAAVVDDRELDYYRGRMGPQFSMDDLHTLINHGDESSVERAQAFISVIENRLNLPPTGGFEFVRSPFGPRVSIGDWLANSPTPCRRKVRRMSDIAPMRVFVGIFKSKDVPVTDYLRRGEAIIAFLSVVQRYRPVELYAIGEAQYHARTPNNLYAVIRLESKPINLSEIGFVIGNDGFRLFKNAFLKANNADPIIYPAGMNSGQMYTGAVQARELELAPEDVYIRGAVKGDPLIDRPEQWIVDELKRIGITEEVA